MAKGDSVTYSKRESTKEIFPDNPEYVWSDGVVNNTLSKEESVQKWFEMLKDRFETFEHDKKSSIFRYYGHDYDDPEKRVIKMPDGVMSSGNNNRMKTQLPEALTYRHTNFNNEKKNGWRVFEKITGKYDVEAADEETLKERMKLLTRFCELLQEDEFVTTYDPVTGKEAITQIDASGSMKPIEYGFPLGLENTDFLHYVVFEPEVIEAEITDDKQIDDIVRFEVLNYIDVNDAQIAPKRAIGVVMSKHGNVLRPHIKYVQSIIGDVVNEYNTLVDEKGAKEVSDVLGKMELPQTQNIVNEDKLVETFKKIGVGALLKKIKSKALIKRLDRIKPPSEGKSGGVSWPVSAGGNYMLWITTDPFEMITKSTGRKWSERNLSCENWDGCYAEGPVSDVKYGNCIVWVYKKGEEEYRHEIGRFILRWGESYKGENKVGVDVGVEAQVYPKDPRESAWGFNLLGAIGMILKDNGLLDYDYCKSPYVYKGYSDKAGSGNVKITYDSKIFLRGQGEVDVGNANALVTMASDENLSYADSGYVLNYGNEQALLALSQNPVVWIYENTIRRLFARALDLEVGPQIIRFLIDSPVANYDWLRGTLDTIEIFDENYDNIQSRISFLPYMMRNPLCSDSMHEAILATHPGFNVQGLMGLDREYIVPIWAIGYLDLYRGTLDQNPIITTAPKEILEMITEEVIQTRFMENMNYGGFGLLAGPNEIDTPRSIKLAKKYHNKMMGMKQLIYQPKLPLKSFSKLLTDFGKLWNKRLNDEGIFDKELEILRKHFAIVMCLPLQNPNGWGWISNFGGLNLGMDNIDLSCRDISVVVDGNEIRYPIYTRQSTGTVKRIIDIFPELVQLGAEGDFAGLLLRNIRDAGGFKELFRNSEVDNNYLLFNLQNPIEQNESIVNPFITKRNFETLFDSMTNYDLLKYSYINKSTKMMRENLPVEIVDKILNDDELLLSVGVDTVAKFLTKPKQFELFCVIVEDLAIGDYEIDEDDAGVVEIIGWTDVSEDERDYIRHYDNIENIYLLNLAGLGLSSNQRISDIAQYIILYSWREISEILEGEYDVIYNGICINLSKNLNISLDSVETLLSMDYDSTFRNEIIKNSRIKLGDNILEEVLAENPTTLLSNYNINIKTYKNVYKSWLNVIKQIPVTKPTRFKDRFTRGDEKLSTTRRDEFTRNDYNPMRYIKNNLEGYEWIRYWRGGNSKKALGLPKDYHNVAPMNPEKGRPMSIIDEPQPILYNQLIITANIQKLDDGRIWMNSPTMKYIKSVSVEDDLIHVTGSKNTIDEQVFLAAIRTMQMNDNEIINANDREKRDNFIQYVATFLNEGQIDELEDGSTSIMQQTTIEFEETYNNFDEMYGFIPADRRPNPEKKWEHDLILVIFDSFNPEDQISLPDWRMNISWTEVRDAIKTMLINPKFSDKDIEEMIDETISIDDTSWMFKSGSGERRDYTVSKVLQAVDKNYLWTPELINKYITFIMSMGLYDEYQNMLPTTMMFDATLTEDEDEFRKQMGVGIGYAERIQLWILSQRFETIIPISYVYECITRPNISANVKTRAKRIREKRLAEYLNLMRRDEDIQVNDAEDMHPHEWRIYNSEINSLLINYCEKMYPYDVKLQEQLMEGLVSGKINVGVDEMISVTKGGF